MSEKKEIKIRAAKGRPMLSWVGKRPLRHVTAFPAQHIETFAPVSVDNVGANGVRPAQLANSTVEVGAYHAPLQETAWKEWPAAYPHGGLLFHGDNKEVLAHLLANGFRGKVKLIYIDPPFDSGADYVRKVQLRGGAATAKIEGESYALGEQIQYTDIWANDNYLQFMYERLILLKELLAEDGSIWLHCDWRKSHHLRLLLDEVFGTNGFRAHIVWRSMTSSGYKGKSSLGRSHADVLYYSKGDAFTYNPVYVEMTDEMLERYKYEDPDGRKFKDSYLGDVTPETVEELRQNNLLYITSSGGYRIKHYLDEAKGTLVDDIWADINVENSQSLALTGYPTQKPEELLARIINLTSNKYDLVLDCFIGSGTTAAVAQKHGRRWIGCDINKGAIQTTAKRLQGIIDEQVKKTAQKKLITTNESSPEPAQLSFGVWRVNDYDLKIQRNEAIKLACEHIGVERIASEGYFDGKLSKKLVKIIPFEHPLSPLDLEELKRELEARLEVENTIVFVCLGIELAARTWIEDWNRLRKGEHTVNKIEVIELRTDAKYGNFIKHEPATAKVSIMREGDKIKVRIEDFISPTILKRLDMDLPLFKAKITDWRSQVDCVMIDTAYNGELFKVMLSNVPEKKNDLIEGCYTLPAPADKTAVAVKIIDMLGEEVLIAERV